MNADCRCLIDAGGGGGCLWFGYASGGKRVPKRLIPLSKWENRLHRAQKESEYLFDRQEYFKTYKYGSGIITLAPRDIDNNIEWWRRFDKFIKLWKIVMTTCAVEKWGAGGVGSVGGGVRPLRVRHTSSTFVNYHQDYEIDDYYYDDGDAYDHSDNNNDNGESRSYRTSWSLLKSEKDFAALAVKLGRGSAPVSEERNSTVDQTTTYTIDQGDKVDLANGLSDMTWYAGVSWEDGWTNVKHPLQRPRGSHDHSRHVWLTSNATSTLTASPAAASIVAK